MIPFNTNSDEPIPTRSSSGIQSLADTWYRLAAPRQVSPSASFKQREIVRRGQTASWILLVVTLLVLLPVPGLLSKPAVLSIVLVVFAIDVGALVLNRFGQIRLAGVIAIFTIEVGLVGTMFSIPGGMGPSDLPLFDLMAQAEIVAVALLGAGWVFLLMGLNIGIIWGILHSPAISPELSHQLVVNGNVFTQLVELQIIIAIFAFILVQTANIAIMRLDRSEEVVALERREIERQEAEIERSQQIESGVQQIQQTLTRAAQGDYTARAQLSQENLLWKLAYSLNFLLQRLQRDKQNEQALERTQAHIRHLEEALYTAQDQQQPITAQRGRTALDAIIVFLNGKHVVPSQPSTSDNQPISRQPVQRYHFVEQGQRREKQQR